MLARVKDAVRSGRGNRIDWFWILDGVYRSTKKPKPQFFAEVQTFLDQLMRDLQHSMVSSIGRSVVSTY